MELIRSILREIANGKVKFEPVDKSSEAILNFQSVAIRLKSAHERNFFRGAHFQESLSRETHGMYIAVLVAGGLTFEGEQCLRGIHEGFEKTNMTNQTINIHSASAIQIGDNNTQQITIAIQSLVEKIESSHGSVQEKATAKKLLQEFLAHPLVTTLVGAAISLS